MDNCSITNLNISPNKSKRGRFIIQETEISNDDDKIYINVNNNDNKTIQNEDNNKNIIDTINITTFESSPKLSELIEKEIVIVNPKLKSYRSTNLTKKRRISASFSKFRVNSKDDFSLNNNNKFFVYDLNSKNFCDINEIFKDFENKFIIHNFENKKYLINQKFNDIFIDDKINNNNNELNNKTNNDDNNLDKNNNKNIIKKDFKRIETYQNLNFNKNNILNSYEKKVNNNIYSIINNSYNKNFKKQGTIHVIPKNIFPKFQKIFNSSENFELLQIEKVISFLIESQNFTQCNILNCTFSL
jgi:hypothetical protein